MSTWPLCSWGLLPITQHAWVSPASTFPIAFLRSPGAPGDAHPKVGVNDDYEITEVTCVTERRTPGPSSQL